MVRSRAVRLPNADFGDERPDYANSFEIHLPGPDDRTAEQWTRAGLENAPPVVRRIIRIAHRHVLGFRLGPHPAAGHVLGWRIDRNTTGLTTMLFYERPVPARLIWAVVCPLHRRIAPLLLLRAAR